MSESEVTNLAKARILNNFLQQKTLEYYKHLTSGGEFTVELTQLEACVALKSYDRGLDVLSKGEKNILYNVIQKLKDEIRS